MGRADARGVRECAFARAHDEMGSERGARSSTCAAVTSFRSGMRRHIATILIMDAKVSNFRECRRMLHVFVFSRPTYIACEEVRGGGREGYPLARDTLPERASRAAP